MKERGREKTTESQASEGVCARVYVHVCVCVCVCVCVSVMD